MFLPIASGRLSAGYEVPAVAYQEASPLPIESAPATPTPVRQYLTSPLRAH